MHGRYLRSDLSIDIQHISQKTPALGNGILIYRFLLRGILRLELFSERRRFICSVKQFPPSSDHSIRCQHTDKHSRRTTKFYIKRQADEKTENQISALPFLCLSFSFFAR